MDSQAISGIIKRESSVISSEESLERSLCVENELELRQKKRNFKSSSLSCLPDLDHFLDTPTATLPAKLSSVKPFTEDLSAGLSVNTCYETAESSSSTLAEYNSSEEDDIHNVDNNDNPCQDQRSPHKLQNTGSKGKALNDPAEKYKIKQDIDLSQINTETQTFVRISALDILAAFPETETVLSGEQTGHRSKSPKMLGGQTKPLNPVSEDGCNGEDSTSLDHVQSCAAKSERVPDDGKESGGNAPEVISWSSSSDVDKRRKKKRLFHVKKKHFYEISTNSDIQASNEVPLGSKEDFVEDKADAETAKTKKRKQKTSSSGLMNFFRGKSEIKEDSPKQEKTKKDRKSLQKSQSFHSGISNSTPKTQQLNRMDSFKKIFKRQRDSAVTSSTDAKDGEQFKCLEISSPILKTEFRSTNLVDREVILRNRAFQSDKTSVKPDKDKDERELSNGSEMIVNDPALNHHENRLVNGSGATKQSPVAPVRWKHLERKRLSTSIEEGNLNVLENNFTAGLPDIEKEGESGALLDKPNGDIKCNENDDVELSGSAINVLECQASPKVKTDKDLNNHSNLQNQMTPKEEGTGVKLNCTTDMSSCKGSSKRDSNTHSDNSNGDISSKSSVGIKVNDRTADLLASHTLDIGNEDSSTYLDPPNGDDNIGIQLKDRIMDSVVHGLSDDSESADSTVQRRPALDGNDNESFVILEHAPKEVNESFTVIHDLASVCEESLPCQSPSGLGDMSGLEDDNEVFVDCTDGRNISFHSSNVVVDDQGMPTASGAVISKGSSRSRKYYSDVSSVKSKHAIETAKIKKKPVSVSFSVGNSSSDPPVSSLSLSASSSSERFPSDKKGRGMSIFAKSPTAKLEQSEPPTLVTDLVPTSFPMISTDRRSQIVLELFTTERTYVRGLETMIELFKTPLAGKIDEKTINALFSNIHDIFAVNKDLLFLLWEKLKHWGNEQCIGQIFVDMEERFKLYAVYCKNFDKSDAVFKKKIRRDKEFDRFLKTCYQDPLCQPGLDLPAYLITIVQRIPRYLLLLKDLSKKTLASHPDYDNLKQALSRVMKVAEYINSQLQEVHGKKAMQELRSTVIGLEAYEVKGRTLLKEAEVCLMSPKKPYKCLLFNDIMVFAVQGSKDRSEIEMTLELKTLWFEDLKKTDPQTNKCDAIELFTPHRPYTMYACSRTDKRVWLQKLRTAIVNLLYGADCEDPDDMDISRRKASDTYIDGSVYCGEYQNGKRHGHGVMAWPNRTRYEGSWADDERHGQGQLTYYTGEKYVGNWVADKKDGEGKQTYVNGDVYCGEWSEGKMHRTGVIDFANGDRFVGEMANNEVEGNGEMTCVSGLVYKGKWKNSKRHGHGHLFFPNGNEYKGEMLNDRICGYGKMTYFNGDEYTGEWVNEMRHGIGCFNVVQGAVYDGQWNNDFMNGQGKMSYPNGDQYTGTWHQNKRVGKGQLMYAHGDTYNGQWEDDVMQGRGVMYYKDGSVYEGAWKRGERHGHGKTVYCDKRLYEGEYLSGFRHGRGKLIYSNNVCYVGEWKADKFDGNGVFSDPNTEYSFQGDWCCGKREGAGVEIYYKTRYEGNWKADMKHGNGIEKSHAGHIFEGTWKENKKHGKGVRILRSKVREEQQWHEGHLIDIVGTVAEDLPSLPRR